MLNPLKKASIVSLLLVISGCSTLSADSTWPLTLPDRQVFVEKFLSTRNLEVGASEEIESHLTWIVRFYQGTVLYPTGWNNVSERFLRSIEGNSNKKEMADRLRSLGILIANEWAQSNNIRKINSSNVAVWGSALRTSATKNDQAEYVSLVERDVKELIAGSLRSDEIFYERYYPSEDYDDF